MSVDTQPISTVKWVAATELHANDYNPNHVFGPELRLLKESIMHSGWTQPVVARVDGEVVDGFHRWTLCRTDKDVAALTGGLVPVVYLAADTPRSEQVMATVRHNRARGQHGVMRMAGIVGELRRELGDEDVCKGLGMEPEELERLGDARSSPDRQGKDSFGRGWVPDPKTL